MQEEFAWKILIDLLSVLRYLHFDKKIVHRDLNPANIMVDSHYSIKLCDFGLAKHFSEDIINNSFVGTLVYTCP
jgi:NIMA (never in mitosis gene a)-related kinase